MIDVLVLGATGFIGSAVAGVLAAHPDVRVRRAHRGRLPDSAGPVADVRDGACSSSTLKEAASWGKVDTALEQMVFAEAGSVMPLLASDAYHRGAWKDRAKRAFGKMFD